MKSIIYSIIFIIPAFLFIGCKNNSVDNRDQAVEAKVDSDSISSYEETIIHLPLCYYDFDKVSDLTVFFDTIIAKHNTLLPDYDDDGHQDDEIKDCIRQIDRYRHGKQKYFPDSLVSCYMSNLGHQCADVINHCVSVDMTFSEWFMMCAAYYAPHITCLVDTQTPDHQAGYLNFGKSYNPNPWWSYMFIKRHKGFEVIRVNRDYVELSGVYQLSDDKNRKYYLFSNNNISVARFHQELFLSDRDSIVKVAETNEFPVEETCYDAIYFDKDNRIWSRCTVDDNTQIYTPIEGTEKVKLILDGKNSRFVHSSKF